MRNTIMQLTKFYLVIIILFIFINDLKADDCNVTIKATSQKSICAADGKVTTVVEGVDVGYLDLVNAQFRIQSVGPGYSTPFAKNGGVFTGLEPGDYYVFMKAFCVKNSDSVEVTKQSLSVTVAGNYKSPNMYVVTNEVRKTLNCIVSGMIPVSFADGVAPYKVVIKNFPASYAGGDTVFTRSSEGKIEIGNLPEGTYVLDLSDHCGVTLPDISVTIGKVASDFPSVNAISSVRPVINTSGASNFTDCKSVTASMSHASTHLPESHELYPYFKNAKDFYEIAITEDGNAVESIGSITSSSITGSAPSYVSSHGVSFSFPTLSYKDFYPADYFPAGGHTAYMTLKVKGTNCYSSTKTAITIKRPYIQTLSSSNLTCDGFDLSVYQWVDYDGLICYPYKVEVIEKGTNNVVSKLENINTSNTVTLTNIPYGEYHIVCTGADGGQWQKSTSTSLLSYIFKKPTAYGTYSVYNSCREDGKTGYIEIDASGSAFNNYFVPGTKVIVDSAPPGQPIPPDVIVSDYITSYVRPYGPSAVLLPGKYYITVTDTCQGSVEQKLTITFPEIQVVYYATSGSDYCEANLNKSYGYIYLYESYNISGGSTFTFVASASTGNPAHVLHKNFTMPSDASRYFNPFFADYSYTGYMEGVDPGKYVFDIWDAYCNQTKRCTIDMPNVYNVKDFDYDKEFFCGGVSIFPKGYMLNGTNKTDTYFRFVSAKDLDGRTISNFDKRVIRESDSLIIQKNGTYILQISYNSSTGSCHSDTVHIIYEQPLPKLRMAETASYVCGGESIGYIKLVSTGGYGTGPYEYEILGTGLKNTTGIFNHGAPNEELTIRIKDLSPEATAINCNAYFDQRLVMLDLSEASIVYSSNNGNFCEGQTIDLNCISLGQTTYTWTFPDGSKHTGQFIKIPNATTAMSGVYTVSVPPENCGDTITQSITITVYENPVNPVLIKNNIELCYRSSQPTYLTATGATAESGHSLKWYMADGITEFFGTSNISTYSYYTNTYYVSQVNNLTGCESQKVPFTVSILALPLAPVLSTPLPECYGTPLEFQINPSDATLGYRLYLNNSSGGTPIDTKQGNGALITLNGGIFPAAATNYYVSTVNNVGCESSPRSRIIVTPKTSGTSGDIEQKPHHDTICSGEKATLKTELSSTSTIVNPIFKWYDSNSASATLLHTGDTYVTENLTYTGYSMTTKAYYVAVEGDNVCETPPGYRRIVYVLIKANVTGSRISATPTTTTLCSGDSILINLTVNSSYAANPTFFWYTSQTETVPFYVGNSYQTPPINIATKYYVGVTGDMRCETLPGSRREITINVVERPIATAEEFCANTTGKITITNARYWVYYYVYENETGGVAIANGRKATSGVGNLEITVGPFPSSDTLYIQSSDSPCSTSARTPVVIPVKNPPEVFPDIRLQVCPEASTQVNLNSYFDGREISAITWANPHGFTLTSGHLLNANLLSPSQTYQFKYTIKNSCNVNSSGVLYVRALDNSGMSFYPPDTVTICKDQADYLILNQIMGLTEISGGTWDFTDLNPTYTDYISIINGSVIFDGQKAWADNKGTALPGGSRKIEIKYDIPANSCNTPTQSKIVFVITPTL